MFSAIYSKFGAIYSKFRDILFGAIYSIFHHILYIKIYCFQSSDVPSQVAYYGFPLLNTKNCHVDIMWCSPIDKWPGYLFENPALKKITKSGKSQGIFSEPAAGNLAYCLGSNPITGVYFLSIRYIAFKCRLSVGDWREHRYIAHIYARLSNNSRQNQCCL